MKIEVVFCNSPSEHFLQSVDIPSGTLVKDVLSYCDLEQNFPNIEFSSLAVGIFSKKVSFDTELTAGDRVEFYRPLTISPMEKRRLLAANRKRNPS